MRRRAGVQGETAGGSGPQASPASLSRGPQAIPVGSPVASAWPASGSCRTCRIRRAGPSTRGAFAVTCHDTRTSPPLWSVRPNPGRHFAKADKERAVAAFTLAFRRSGSPSHPSATRECRALRLLPQPVPRLLTRDPIRLGRGVGVVVVVQPDLTGGGDGADLEAAEP